MMRVFLPLPLICCLLLNSAFGSLSLVRDGKAVSKIVIADDATPSARRAAEELRTWLKKVSGADVPIVRESRFRQDGEETVVLVGQTNRTKKLGLDPSKFDLEELRIRTFPGVLVLVGDDERPDGLPLNGTLWAVETFAEKHLGVRVLWPGPLGEIVPEEKTIEIGDLDIRYVPPLRQRRIRNLGYRERLQRGLDRLGWSAEAFKERREEAEPWFQFHRIGGSYRGSYGHAFGDYWKRFHQANPDWFALQPDGTRDNSRADDGHRARLCVSNRGLIEQVARDSIARMQRNAILDTVSISPNDGSGGATFCMCDKCESWDAPEGRPVEVRRGRETVRHVSFTDRFVRFYSSVAEIAAKQEPDRYLGAYAYSVYKSPPVHATLHPNVVIGFVPNTVTYLNEDVREEMRHDWLGWSKTAKHLFLRPNWLRAGMGFPASYVHRMAEDIRFFARRGMMVTDFDCCEHEWAGDGLNYYVLAKLLWNPDADVEEIVDDYCRSGFGPAAPTVREYYRHLETMTDALARKRAYQGRGRNDEVLAQMYTDAFLERAHEWLDTAAAKAGDTPIVKQRIVFLRKALEYARIRRDWTLARAAARRGDREAGRRVREIEAERNEWYQDLGLSWALNAVHLQTYGY